MKASILLSLLTIVAGYEWAGIFATPYRNYMWTAQKAKEEAHGEHNHMVYPDASMKIVALPATNATAEILQGLKEKGASAMETECLNLTAGESFAPEEGKCYRLQFDNKLWQSLFVVDATATKFTAFFAEHVPIEFEATAHYLKDSEGNDVEPVAELDENGELKTEPELKAKWGVSLLASLIVNLMTLAGVILAIPGIQAFAKTHGDVVEGIFSAFAAGALMACACYIMLFEATHLVADGSMIEGEAGQTFWWGTAILVGYFLPIVVESFSLCFVPGQGGSGTVREVEMGEQLDKKDNALGEADTQTVVVDPATRSRVLSAVLVGDFFHNFCDGVFIGTAFKGCGMAMGVGVTVSSALHELPQELADYTILTGNEVGFSPAKALMLNFLSGLGVILGTIVINVSDLNNTVVGLLLAFGGGTYVYLASAVCMPKFAKLTRTLSMHLGGVFAFLLGAFAISLILLDHAHCVVGEGGHGGHGGGHGGH